MSKDDLTYLDIKDFTPGIHEVYSSDMAPGTARNTTQGCYASPRTGLTGLPSNDWSFTPTAAGIQAGSSKWQVNGFLVIPAVSSLDDPDISFPITTYAPAGEFIYMDITPDTNDSTSGQGGGTGTKHSVAFYLAYERVDSTPNRQAYTYVAGVVANPTTPPETLIIHRTGNTAVLRSDVGHTWILFTRSIGDKTAVGARDPTETGTPVVVICHTGINNTLEIGDLSAYYVMTPDPTTLPNASSPTTLDFGLTGAITPGIPEGRAIIHQGRIVTGIYVYFGRYGDSTRNAPDVGVYSSDQFVWTESNTVNYDFTQAFADVPFGFGCWGSLTASDLFIITHADGGLLIQGDLNAPIVRKLPGVTGTAGLSCSGVDTPLGFVYGVGGSGVWAWQGNNSSKFLSPQLSDQFWVAPSASKHTNHKGTFAQWGNWLLCPNNWMMDMDTGSWWKLDTLDPAVINWQASPSGSYAYGSVATWQQTPAQPVVRGYNKFVKRSTWQWDSHPFVVTAHRRVTVREIILVAKCTTTSTVDIVLYDEAGVGYPVSFALTPSTSTQAPRIKVNFDAYNLSISIISASGDAEVYGVRLGYQSSTQQVPENP